MVDSSDPENIPQKDSNIYKGKILSIDDNIDVSNILKAKFEEAGYQIELAHDGPSGLAKIKDYKPDIVLLGIMMPFMDGYEVLRRIKSDPDEEIRDAHVIMVTARRQREYVIRAMSMGAKDYVIKPFDFRRLLDKVSALI